LPDLQGDLAAGTTVGVMLIPQSMAYAMLAGMPPIYGLYAGLVPLVVYALLGTSKHLAFGPVAVDMIIVGAGVGALAGSQTEHIEMVVMVVAMTGVIEIVMGVLGFGFMVNFLSRPVIAGFMTAAPLIIAASQLENLMGVEIGESGYVHMQIWHAIQHVGEAHDWALTIGLSGIVFLLVLQRWAPKLPSALIWTVLATLTAWGLGLEQQGLETVRSVAQDGAVPTGLPSFEMHAFNWSDISSLIPTAITLALVQFMTVMSLGQAFAAEHDYSVDANRELFAVGTANFLGSFFRIVPCSGSFSRSAVNNRAGARTPMSNVIAAAWVAITLLFLTALIEYLPISALAAIIMVACIGMIDVPELRYLLKTRWIDGAVALLTFGATLGVGIQEGLLIGIGASIVVVMYDLTQPNVVELGHVPGTQEFRDLGRNPEAESISDIHIIRIDSRFSFANAKLLKEELLEQAEEDAIRALIIDTSGVNDLDTTATQALKEVIEEVSERDIEFYVVGAKGPVRDVMRRSGLQELIGENNFFLNTHLAVTDLLGRWDEESEYGPTEQQERQARIQEQLERERERIEQERQSISEERERLEEELDDHERERDEIDDERDRLQTRLEEMKQRRRELGEELGDEGVSPEVLEERQEEIEEHEEKLEQQREELEAQREELEATQEELEAERERMLGDQEEILDERDRLTDEIERHLAEQREIANTRQNLQDRLREAEKQREKLRSEREKMEEQQQELEAERKRLEAERRKVAPNDQSDESEQSDETNESESTDADGSDDEDESSGSDKQTTQTDPNKEFDQPV
jgi:SulP family sulfate permease